MSKPTEDPAAEPLTPERLAEIQARANAATPGPWQWRIATRTRDYQLQTVGWDIVMGFARWGRDSAQPEFNIDGLLHHGADLDKPHPDAEFIAAARQDVVDLLAEIGRLRERLATEQKVNAHLVEKHTATLAAADEWMTERAQLLAENDGLARAAAPLPVRQKCTVGELKLLDEWMQDHGDDPAEWPERVRLAYANTVACARAKGTL